MIGDVLDHPATARSDILFMVALITFARIGELVPGRWEEDDVRCGHPGCRVVAAKNCATPCDNENVLKHECKLCAQERAIKKLVLAHPNDPRLEEPNFRNAPAIFGGEQ